MAGDLIEDIQKCKDAVDCLFNEKEVAMDIEGVSLSRAGEACILQIYAPSTSQVYLFDIEVLKKQAFEEGGLKRLLEEPSITKIFFDVRADCDALYHLHDVSLCGAYDLQILYDVRFAHPLDEKLVGLGKVMHEFFRASRIISPEKQRELETLKEHGRKSFIPDKGGSYEVWKKRPLSKELIDYATADVKFLFDMKQYWGVCKDGSDSDLTEELNKVVELLSMKRLQCFVHLPDERALDQDAKKNRDFELPVEFNFSKKVAEIVTVPEGKRGLVIGKKGATKKAIESSSGARVNFNDQSGKAVVTGQEAEVQEAVRQIEAKISSGYKEESVPEGSVSEIVMVPEGKRGLVIGRQGATIKAIESSSGARVNFNDQSGKATVFGQEAEVQEAVRQIKNLSSGYTKESVSEIDAKRKQMSEKDAAERATVASIGEIDLSRLIAERLARSKRDNKSRLGGQALF